MILSAMMLNAHFVNAIAGLSVHQTFTPSHRNAIISDPTMWLPPRKPPDKLRYTCRIKTANQLKTQPNTLDTSLCNKSDVTWQVNSTNVTYSTQNTGLQTRKGTLVDRGTNGGIAGSDTRIMDTHPTRRVDIEGIDKHRLPDIPIVTAGAVVTTQKGDVIVVMNQYASVRTGKTIHSCGQIEAFGHIIDDKSIKVGGKQRLITPDGYVIPLQVCNGLVYMDMHPYTDQEKADLPIVQLTSDLDWCPSSIDYEHDSEQWFDAMENLPDLHCNHPFDEHGDYLHTHDILANLHEHLDTANGELPILTDDHIACALHHEPSPADFRAIQPQFGWLPINIIMKTFAKTTQFYRKPMSTRLQKHYKSPFPACNVQRRNEPIATDTVYSDTPAIDSGCKCAQIFVGTKTMVADVYGMKTEKQFVNTLQDIIRHRGAPTKLLSDHANLEISAKVKDILYLVIPN